MNPSLQSHFRRPPLWMYLVAYVIPYLFLVAVALYWPAQWSPWGLDFTQSPWVRMVPSISAYVDKSPFPHATAAYFVLSGILTLPLFWLGLKYPTLLYFSRNSIEKSYDIFKKKRFIGLVGIPLLFLFVTWITWIQPGYQFGLAPVRDQRWALAVFGFWFSFYFETLYFVLAIRVRHFFENLYKLEGKHHGME